MYDPSTRNATTRRQGEELAWLGDFAPDTTTRLHAERFLGTLGREVSLVDGARSLGAWVKALHLPVVGAHYVSCSDECEEEAVSAFERHFVRNLLPSLRSFDKAAFRSRNLGGRYEWGSLYAAEGHFSRAKGADVAKAMVVKVHAHVATESTPAGTTFGTWKRYASEGSRACGALAALLAGERTRPYLLDLEESFHFEGVDRLARLAHVDEAHRPFVAAVVHARLQARRVMLDVQEERSRTPTRYFVVASVTLNRKGRDTELPVGLYLADHVGDERRETFLGVKDDPSKIRVVEDRQGLRVEAPGLAKPRPARDHRRLLREALAAGAVGRAAVWQEPRSKGVLAAVVKASDEHPVAKATLKALAPLLLELAPVPAAAALFGVGALSIHHAAKAHRLVEEAHRDETARAMLQNVQREIDALSPEQAEHALTLLRQELSDRPGDPSTRG